MEESTPQYRPEPPTTLPQILLHYSLFRNIWEWIILVLTLSSAITVPYAVCFPVGAPADDVVMMVSDAIVDVVFFIDLILNFHTTFVDDSGQVVSRPELIRGRYLKTWFFADLISSLPYDVLYSIPTFNGGSSHDVKLLRLFRLVRIARTVGRFAEYGHALLLLLILAFLLVSHWFACIWFLVGYHETCILLDKNSWLYRLSQDIGQNFTVTFRQSSVEMSINLLDWKSFRDNMSYSIQEYVVTDGPGNFMSYVTALYFVLTSLNSVGFGNVCATTTLEKFVCCLIMIFGAILYASIFGNVTTLFQQLYMSTGMYHEMLNNIKEFMKINNIPLSLKERVLDYVVSTWTANKGVDQTKVLSYCPNDMRADICIHLNRKVFEENPAFRLASEGCLRALAVHFTMMHSAPGDVICHQGESLSSVGFVASGTLEVVQDDEIIAILGPGDVFGDPLCREATAQCSASVRCLTYCDLHVISREHLAQILNFHQSFAQSFSRNLIFTCNLRNRFIFRKIEDVKREKELKEREKDEDSRSQPLIKLLASRLKRQNSVNQKLDLNNRVESNFSVQNNFFFQHNLNSKGRNSICYDPKEFNSIKEEQTEQLSSEASKEKNEISQETLNARGALKLRWLKRGSVSMATNCDEKMTNLEKESILLDTSAVMNTMKKTRELEIKNMLHKEGNKNGEVTSFEASLQPPLSLADQKNLVQVLTKLKVDMKDERERITRRMLEVESNIGHVISALLLNMNEQREDKDPSNNSSCRNERSEVSNMNPNPETNQILAAMNQDLDLL